jgi:hypothetical protein
MAEPKYTHLRAVNGVTIEQRAVDGYFDATALCAANGKVWNNYRQLTRTKEFLAMLAQSIGIELFDLVRSTTGRHTGRTWVHPRVAVHLAQWCSPAFAVLVTAWIDEWSAQPLFQEQVRERAPLVAPVIEQIGSREIESLTKRFEKLQAEVVDLAHRREPFSIKTRRRVAQVVLHCHGGKDPAGSGEKIVDDDGNFLAGIAELDHFNNNRRDARIENCFPMHKRSHEAKTRGHDFSTEFLAFHNNRLRLEDRTQQRQPDLFGPPKK